MGHLPWGLLNAVLRLLGPLDARVEDTRAPFAFFQTGRFVADTTRQAQLLGPVPTAEDAVGRWLDPTSSLTTGTAS